MPINEELVIDVADRIRDILNDYPSGPAILREILQNTDDAGGRVQRFILDLRQHSVEGLVDPLLKDCQGPAIIAYNDSSFTPQDWIAIRSISNSSKKGDERSTGKFGLGFCTSYHVTDYPHVLSGDKLLILDPHKKIKSSSGCIAFSTHRSGTESDREKYPAHFDAFRGILSPGSDTFDGTTIRLPLRLPDSKSRINPMPMSVEAARDLFDTFIKDDLPEVMLYLKHITSIELSEISSDGTEAVRAIIQIKNADEITGERSKSRGRSNRAETSHYELEVSMKSNLAPPNSTSYTRRWIITHYVDSFGIASNAMVKRLDRVENPDGVEDMMIADKLFPHVALAFPVPDTTLSNQTFFGRLFTLLPLPIITHFPLHIHAALALTSSRQNLRNADEKVMDPKGRLRVEWNRLIFTRFVPEAWISLMKYLVSTSRDFDVFDIWPSSSIIRDGGHGYWPRLPYLVLKEASTRDVWPLWSKQSSRQQLASVVVTLKDSDPDLLLALVSCNVPVVIVPSNVLADIAVSEFKDKILSPATAVSFLRVNSKILSGLPSITIKLVCDYLVTASDVNIIFNLPIIPNVQGTHTSISSNLVYTLANESEANVFRAVDPKLLAAHEMSPPTLELLLTQCEGKIRALEPKDVVSYLKKRVGGLGGPKVANVAVNPLVHKWLADFWAWLDGWERRDELYRDHASWKAITQMYALPLRTANNRPAARLAGGLAIHPVGVQEEVLSTLVTLEVPVLPSPFTDGLSTMMVSTGGSNVKFILQNLPKKKTLPHFNQATRGVLKNFLAGHLSYLLLSPYTTPLLDSECRTALRGLPVFPLLHPGRRNSEEVVFDTAPEGSLFVSRSVPVVPNIRRTQFIDYDQAVPLCQALGVEVLDEIAVLKIAITRDVWAHLHPDLVPAVIDRLIWRLPDFDQPMRRLFSELEFIDVGDQGACKSPNFVIDPASSLAGLFDLEDEVLPAGEFAIDEQGSYIQRLRNNNMLQTILTDAMVEERIDKIVALSEEGEPERGRQKALRLLSVLDKHSREQSSSTQSPELMEILHQRAWIPLGDQLYQLSDLWDSRKTDTLLCDWALHILPIEINSPSFRISIGWEVVPFDVLRRQLIEVTGACSDCQLNAAEEISDRIKAILRTLASRLMTGLCTDEELQHLADELGNAEWVPISEGRRIRARRTWIPTDLKSAHQQLGSRFFPVAASLLKEDGMKDLLGCMGIPERPSHADLHASQLEILGELSQLDPKDDTRDDLIQASIELALEIHRDREPEELSQLPLLVPTESGTLVEAENVLYNDMEMDAQRLQDGTQFAHPLLSSASAKVLGLQTYRGRQLSQLESADDDDGFYIGEDVTTRIKSVLLDYTIDHSFNEWVANAADAGATCLKLLVDESVFGGKEVIPTKSEFPPGPALVIYNDGLFSEEDFRGIGNIGQGGKAGKSNTIGRFGLGALSFYHFTELPMIVSGNSVLLLDPSRQHLHLRRSRGIRITLDICLRHWPDQLKPLEGIFDFFAHKGYYNGTLFRLPLRTVSQAESSSLSNKHLTPLVLFNIVRNFYTSANRSLFFTSLREISTHRRGLDEAITSVWSVTGARTVLCSGGGVNSLSAMEVTVAGCESENGKSVDERWLVTRSWASNDSFPSEFRELSMRHRLSNLQPNFGLAFNLSSKEYASESTLFATLPLPVPIALPVHLHATWILAPDRRSIRNDTAVQGNDVPLDSQYNRHILQHFVPPLYLQTLAYINEHYSDLMHLAWPQGGKDDGEVMVATALYHQLPGVPDLVLRTVDGERISPKDATVHLNDTPDVVKKLLTSLSLPSYVAEPHFNTDFFKNWEHLRGDSPAVVAQILRSSVAAVQELFRGDSPALTIKDLQSIVQYLLDAKESLIGIPLLPLGDGRVVTFQNPGAPRVFVRERERIGKLFGLDRVLNPEIDFKTGCLWATTRSLNLTNYYITTLIGEVLRTTNPPVTPKPKQNVTKDQLQWTRELLVLLVDNHLKWEDVADFPLVPTRNGDLTVSLNYAKSGNVWIWAAGGEPSIAEVFLQLQIPVVDLQFDRVLPLKECRTTSEALRSVLTILRQFNSGTISAIHERVRSDDWAKFTTRLRSWIQDNTLYSLEEDPKLLDALADLPLFEGWQGPTPQKFVPSSKLAMLPMQEDIPNIAQFLPPSMIVAPRTSDLEAILSRRTPAKLLSFAEFFKHLNIQRSQLPEDLHASLRIIITLVANHHKGQYPYPLIPDEDGVPKRPAELYDHRVELYALRFKGRRDLFIHPAFRDLIDGIIPLGIRHDFSPQDVQELIETVDKDANNGEDVMERAKWVWRYINDYPLAMGGIDYGVIRGRRFIPRRGAQYSPDPKLNQYAPTLDIVVSPDDVHLDEYAPLLWTLRAPFESSPTATLKRVYPEIGSPTVEHVIRHLINLATSIATHELHSETLFRDVQNIYEWLRMHQKEAQQHLESASSHPIWLNVDSVNSPWIWCTATQLVFDLTRDTKRSFRPKEFLSEYRELIVAAGAQKRRYATIDPQQLEVSHSEKNLAGWRELRRREVLFDIWFKPEGFVIGAHRGMLAALIPQFAPVSGDESCNSLTPGPVEYPLPDGTSEFAVRAVIDYVYMGTLSCPTPTTHDDVTAVLERLLDLLKLVHTWEIPDLEAQTVAVISELKLVDEDNCDFVLKQAEAYKSTALAQYCMKTKELNGWI